VAIKHDPKNPHGLAAPQISAIHQDKNGNLWVGTRNNGISILDASYMEQNIFNPEDLKFTYLSKEDGLPDNIISDICNDRSGNIWIATLNELVEYSPENGMMEIYDNQDGMNIKPYHFSQQEDKDQIFLGGTGGMVWFNPDSMIRNTSVPPIVFTDFRLNDKNVPISDTTPLKQSISYIDRIDLKHDENFIEFTFAALNFTNPEKNKYKYFMEGVDRDTVFSGFKRTAEYRDLRPGHYTFWVTGSNNDGVWNEEGISIDIIIRPPWYKADLAYGSYGLLFVLTVLGFIRMRTRNLQKDKERLEEVVRERTDEVEKQKNELYTTLENLKKTQVQLIQSEKMASLGGLVAGMAHEINTPVGISVTAASTLAEETRQMAELYKAEKVSRARFMDFLNTTNQSARLILSNMERTAGMVQSFKQVSADQSTEEKRKFLLKAYIEDVFRSLYPKLKTKKIRIDLDMDEKLEVDSYPGVFSQIFTNLALNSLVHGFSDLKEGEIQIKAEKTGTELQIEYRDNGKGIPEENLPRIFEPFFTTSKSSGSGLGLHIVYNLVHRKLNGKITCKSESGKGAIFTITMPVR
jgi:signal transduction histidine kinase